MNQEQFAAAIETIMSNEDTCRRIPDQPKPDDARQRRNRIGDDVHHQQRIQGLAERGLLEPPDLTSHRTKKPANRRASLLPALRAAIPRAYRPPCVSPQPPMR